MSAKPPAPHSRPDWQTARNIAHRAPARLPAAVVPLAAAAARILATDIAALADVPHYASSAMDGWAVAGDGPWMLVPAGRRALTDSAAEPDPSSAPLTATVLAPGTAELIVTGGLVPAGADRVVPSERGTVDAVLLTEESGAVGRDHIRAAGEEARQGDIVLHRGIRLNPAHIAVAASCGHDGLPVRARPRVALVLTGDEVQLSGIPRPGFVRDSFGVTLPSLIGSFGGEVVSLLRSRDSLADLLGALRDSQSGAPAPDLIVTTGGTGASGVDHLHDALRELGAELLVDRVAMRPGGPSLVARLPDGCLLLGLPGNPLAAMVALVVLGHPLLAGSAGESLPPVRSVVTRDALEGRAGAVLLSPYRLVDGQAVLNAFTGSAMMRGLADADGLLVCPAEGAPAGATLDALPTPWNA
ncbi:hypothetical protein B7R21_14890 [Subtercola boreus]|uniref:Molybdopterin molybdenumtransferase n=1 Tax=Subtercola boreus TaxID=120213 RepID=A0A3E0VDD0_9MICO|nr:molybdopterin molybdotransferase MoeA [Subtercola boreus]RFA07478.1 hypothetical protein B7R21_14890 [Subtercola boreus]